MGRADTQVRKAGSGGHPGGDQPSPSGGGAACWKLQSNPITDTRWREQVISIVKSTEPGL